MQSKSLLCSTGDGELLVDGDPVPGHVCIVDQEDRRGQAGDPATHDVGVLLVDTRRRWGVNTVIVSHVWISFFKYLNFQLPYLYFNSSFLASLSITLVIFFIDISKSYFLIHFEITNTTHVISLVCPLCMVIVWHYDFSIPVKKNERMELGPRDVVARATFLVK